MLRFVPDNLQAKKMCKNAFKKLPFVIKYIPDQYKTKKCGIKLLKKMVECQRLFLTATRMTKLVIKLLIITLMY